MKIWYLVHFKLNSHYLAIRNLNRQGFETFLPMEKITNRKTYRFSSQLKPLFSGYMFIKMNPELEPWHKINSTIGVSRLFTFNGKPKSLPAQFMSGLILKCDERGILLPSKNLNKGDKVEIIN